MMDKSPDRFGSVSISKYIRAGCSDCQDLFELSELREVFAGLRSFRRATRACAEATTTGHLARIARRS
jgi:hypothetical protein